MKKLISLLLVIIITCSVLSGCKLDGIFGTMTTVKRIPPSERPAEADNLVLDLVGDFNEYDIEFIKIFPYVHYGRPGYDQFATFRWAMEILSTETDTLYKVNVDIDKEPYFISIYNKDAYFAFTYQGNSEKVKWYKHDDFDSKPETIDGMEWIGSYAVYDCVVEKDILNDVVYNHSCKYYVPISTETGLQALDGLFETVVWSDLSHIFGRTTPITITHSYDFIYGHRIKGPYYSYGKDIYQYYIDENGVEYLVNGNNYHSMEDLVNYYWKH